MADLANENSWINRGIVFFLANITPLPQLVNHGIMMIW